MDNMSPDSQALTSAQLFGLALSGVLMSQNNQRHDALFSVDPTPENKSEKTRSLSRDWGIRTAKDLTLQLDSLASNNGHNQEFLNLVALLASFNYDGKQAFIDAHKADHERYAKLTIVNRAAYRMRTSGIFAWDCGRHVMLCRSGALIGMLSVEEAWQRIMQIARQVQPMYADWYSYGISYVTGRHFWNANLSVDHVTTMMRHVKQLCSGKNAPWSIPWHVDLS